MGAQTEPPLAVLSVVAVAVTKPEVAVVAVKVVDQRS
jgi:hypothetical protein